MNKAKWIWYPDDFEIWLHAKVSLRRKERGSTVPPIWRLDTCWQSVCFRKRVNLDKAETVRLYADGSFYVTIDWVTVHDLPGRFVIPAGEHEIMVTVANETGLPSILMEGETVFTDDSWEVSPNTRKYLPAACGRFEDPSSPPSAWRLPVERIRPVSQTHVTHPPLGRVFDFGRETFGYIRLHGLQGAGKISLYYGESQEEALSPASCETLDSFEITAEMKEHLLPESRAFRFVYAVCETEGISFEDLSADCEYLPVEYKGAFRCSDETVNRIWDTAAYTLHLNTREFFLDGIKRDRWVWSGDAYQGLLMNFYSFFDNEVCKRTLVGVRGKDPVETHLNHIMDYSFYWFLSVYEYGLYTGDQTFIRRMYPKMVSLMDFCLVRTNGEGRLEGRPEDWVFVDWADMDNRGEVSTEQLLFARSLEIMIECSEAAGDTQRTTLYREALRRLMPGLLHDFWDEELGGLVHSRLEGKLNRHLTKYPNIFALLFGYLDESRRERIRKEVLLNSGVQPIVTPYMRFYELAALCECGEHESVMEEIVRYWGGMLDLGATTFWEAFDPKQSGAEHYAMYGRPYGKSLCHAWGASPLYLLGKYFLGVRPESPGYAAFRIEPKLGGLEWIRGKVPLPDGDIEVYMDRHQVSVTVKTEGTGRLIAGGTETIIDKPGLYVVTYGKEEDHVQQNSGKPGPVGGTRGFARKRL